jgi:Sulfotransferase family
VEGTRVEALLARAAKGHELAERALQSAETTLPAASAVESIPADRDLPDVVELERKLIWIMGSPRSGSSWLMHMLRSFDGVAWINEPFVGPHLVPLGQEVDDGEYWSSGPRADDPSYLFARPYMPTLLPHLRRMVLEGMSAQLERFAPDGCQRVIVKEPNGSHATDTIFSLLPNARLIFLLRDGRDVLDSLADALREEESWWVTGRRNRQVDRDDLTNFIRRHSHAWLIRTNATQRAFDRLDPERRLLVRYESLLAETEGELGRIARWAEFHASPAEIAEVADRHRYEAVPPSNRGPGKAVRRARPGGWRERFGEEEIALMEEVMGEKLTELGYELG